MKIKLSQALNSINPLRELAVNTSLNRDPAYRIGRALASALSIEKIFLKEQGALAEALADVDDNGNPITEIAKDQFGKDVKVYKMSDEKKEKLIKQIEEIQEKEIEIWGKHVLLSELGNIQPIRPIVFTMLEWLIVEVLAENPQEIIN